MFLAVCYDETTGHGQSIAAQERIAWARHHTRAVALLISACILSPAGVLFKPPFLAAAAAAMPMVRAAALFHSLSCTLIYTVSSVCAWMLGHPPCMRTPGLLGVYVLQLNDQVSCSSGADPSYLICGKVLSVKRMEGLSTTCHFQYAVPGQSRHGATASPR